MKLQGQLPLGAKKKMCKDLKMSQSHINRILKDEDGTYNATPLARRTVWNYVREHYPELIKPEDVTVIQIIKDGGERVLAAVCNNQDESKRVVDALGQSLPMRRIETANFKYGQLTREAAQIACIDPDTLEPIVEYAVATENQTSHPLSKINEHDHNSRDLSTLRVVLQRLGCSTLEDAAKIPLEDISRQRGVTKATIFLLKELFVENGIEYEESSDLH